MVFRASRKLAVLVACVSGNWLVSFRLGAYIASDNEASKLRVFIASAELGSQADCQSEKASTLSRSNDYNLSHHANQRA
jgi:hypothetical protein